MALGSTQPLAKMSTRNIPGGKGGRCARLTTSPPSHARCHEIWEPKPPGTLWITLGLLRDTFASSEILYHSSRRTSSSCLRDDGGGNMCVNLHSKTDHSGSMTFKSGDCGGHGWCWRASLCSSNEDWTLLAEWESLTFTFTFRYP
jgi:hypothetical protein